MPPSLLPRGWVLQGVIAGVTAAIGYGVGVALAWFFAELTEPRLSPTFRRRAWQVLIAREKFDVPLIIITGHDTPGARARVIERGAKAYLRKPVDDELLLTAISDAIGGGAPAASQ